MANVHGFRDIPQDNPRGGGYNPAQQGLGNDQAEMAEHMQNFVEIQDQLPLLGNSNQAPGSPRN